MSGDEAPLIFLMNMLKDEAIAYMDLKANAEKELKNLRNELGRLEAYLRDAAENYKKTNAFKENERQIRELVYEVQDTIDMCLTKKASAKTKNFIRKFMANISSKLENQVKYLRKQRVAHALSLLNTPQTQENTNTQPQRTDAEQGMATWGAEQTYNELSYDKKLCFLYTGLFPQGYKIPASRLTQLWIAEGFINPVNGKTFEESAEEVLKYLIDKKLLKEEKKRLTEVKTCSVDDAIREFCNVKAMEQSLFTVIEPPVHDGRDLYRLCFHSDPSDFLSDPKKPKGPYVRSFLCLLNDPLYLDPRWISTITEAFEPLRVLNCESTRFEEFPNIEKLILLKHLTLSIDKLDVLPREFSHLLNLETLIVETKSRFIRVKANIWKMTQLRHLKTKVSFILDYEKKSKMGVAVNLQTLSRLSHKSCMEDLDKKAPKLKKLGIRGDLVDLLEKFSFQKFALLENLTLEHYLDYGSDEARPLLCLPDPQAFPSSLKKLTLSRTHLVWDRHMVKLAGITNLEVLKLKNKAFKGATWNTSDTAFKNLKFLLIENTDLCIWEASGNPFPELKCLVVKNCRLQKIPDSIITEKLEKLERD